MSSETLNGHGGVLVLGDNPSSSLAVVRSLGRSGLTVVLGTQDAQSIARLSRFVSEVIYFNQNTDGIEAWLDKLADVLQRRRFDLVIPVTDGYLVPIVRSRARFELYAKLAIPDDYGFQNTYLKQNTLALAERLGVPIPRTVFVCDVAELREAEPQIEDLLPVVIKPVSSKVWKEGKRIDLFASIVQDLRTFRGRAEAMLAITPVLIQNYFPGVGVGQEFLTDRGAILSAFQHERLHEPLGGGGSLYRKSVPLNNEMLKHSKKMLDDMKWTGVAMVEYKWNPVSGEFVLMEINGRFWGSLPLAVSAGVDFPADLYKLLVEGRKPTVSSYRLNVYCRNATQDILWFMANWRAERRNPNLIAVPKSRAVMEWLRAFRGNERWDSLTLDDPRPGIEDWRNLLRHITDRLQIKTMAFVLHFLAKTGIWQRTQECRFRRLLRSKPTILFVCYGNICRSPFAEQYAQRLLKEHCIEGIDIRSAGTYPYEKRPTPREAQLAGEEFGIDLREHFSVSLNPDLIRWAGVVVCMDLRNYEELRRTYPEVRYKLFFLRPFALGTTMLQIADPWGESSSAFQDCFRQVAASLDGMISRGTLTGLPASSANVTRLTVVKPSRSTCAMEVPLPSNQRKK